MNQVGPVGLGKLGWEEGDYSIFPESYPLVLCTPGRFLSFLF